LISEGNKRRDVEVPRGFWWPQGSAVLTVNWLLGDFETNHRTPSERRKAFGVTFWRAGSRFGTPSDAEPRADHSAVADKKRSRLYAFGSSAADGMTTPEFGSIQAMWSWTATQPGVFSAMTLRPSRSRSLVIAPLKVATPF
jgi:hypothetical protein